jgi:hypothetical protein
MYRWFNAVGSETLQTALLCLWFSFTQDVQFADLCVSEKRFGRRLLDPSQGGNGIDPAGPKGSALRSLDHVITVFDFHDRKPFQISNLRELSRAFARERAGHYAHYSARGLPLPTEGDLLPAMPLFAPREGRRFCLSDRSRTI